MKSFMFLFFLTLPAALLAQNSGSVVYEEKIQFKIDFGDNSPMDEELKSMIPSSRSTQKVLHFSEEHSIFKNLDSNQGDETISDQSGNTDVQIVLKRPENVVYQNFTSGKVVEKRDFMDRIFLISDDTENRAWKITGEQKEILGYLCQKATTQRDSSVIEAWFTPQIPISGGPANYGGLPGLILETNRDVGETVVTATKIDFSADVTNVITPPVKGKKVNRTQFAKIQEEKIKEMQEQYGGSGNGTRIFIQRN
ncbi:MAG: GLPGLI family protein [Bacteroidota bacterium]